MSETDTRIKDWLAAHPKMIGVLFTVLVLLGKAGTAAAGNSGVISGP